MSAGSEHDASHTPADDAPPSPGSVLQREILDRFKISQSDLARLTGVSRVRINQILKGGKPISLELALRLGKVTRTDPAYWICVQNTFDFHQKSIELQETLAELVELAAHAHAA